MRVTEINVLLRKTEKNQKQTYVEDKSQRSEKL